MCCIQNNQKSTLYAANTSSQTITAGSNINFGSSIVSSGVSISYSSSSDTVTLEKAGIYKVTVNADILADDAGTVVLSLANNGSAIAGAEATYTAVASGIAHIGFTTLVSVNNSCCIVNNAAAITASLSAASVVSNATIVVEKLV